MVPSATDPTVGHVRHFAAASVSLSQQLCTFGRGICNTTAVNIVSVELNNALSKAVTRIYFRGCWGTTQHSLYGRSPNGRGGGGVLGEDAASPLPTS